MTESNLTNNEMAERQAVKKPFFKIILLFIFLIILAIFLYFFKDTFLSIINKKIDTKDTSTEVSEKESPFGNLVPDLDVESEVKEPKYYIDLYDEYKMGEMGVRYEFKGLDRDTMSLKLIERTESGNIEKTFPLYKDFLMVCTTYDFGVYFLDFSNLQDTDKYSTALRSSSMTVPEKIKVLEEYPRGEAIALIFTEDFDSENTEIKKILLKSSDLSKCYYYD